MQKGKEISITAFTLKSFDFGDYDKILALFSKEAGIVRVLAKGIKKPTAKLGGRLELLNSNKLVIRQGSNLGTVLQCETYKNFPLLRTDYDKLIYSLYLGELVLLFSHEGEPSEAIFDLLVKTFSSIEKSKQPLTQIIWFQMRLLSIMGYHQNLESCEFCHNELEDLNQRLGFSLMTGSIICPNCLKSSYDYKLIDDNFLKLLKIIRVLEVENTDDFDLPEDILNKIQDTIKEYLSRLSERKIKTLSILESH